jgi:hypothetical protein
MAMTAPTDDTTRILELEAWFDQHRITWTLDPDVPVADIDALAGLANQARLSPLDEDVVDRYAADMHAGAHFPPIVVRRHRRKLIPVGGNHRTAAARRAGIPTLAAYIVTSLTDDQVHLLAIEDNRRHGLPLSDDERLYHAIQLVNAGRMVTEAANICGLAPNKVQRQLDANRGAARAIRLEVDGWLNLSTTNRAKCSSVRDDRLFARLVPLIASGAIPSQEVPDIVARLNGAELGRHADELLDALEDDAQNRTRRTTGHPVSKMRAPATRLVHDLDGILSYEPDAVARDCHSPEQKLRVANQIKVTARRLMAIEKELWA